MNTKRNKKQQPQKSTVIGVRLEAELVDRLRVVAAQEDRSLSGSVRKIVKDHFAETPDPDLPTAA